MERTSHLLHHKKMKKLAMVLKNCGIQIYEYFIKKDRLVIYDEYYQISRVMENYLASLEQASSIHPEDRLKGMEFFSGQLNGPVDVRIVEEDGRIARKILDGTYLWDEETEQEILLVSAKDVTLERKREEILENQAKRDSLTMLYNKIYGKEMVSRYLAGKKPGESCGLMVIDIDNFKNVNDSYGHLFGDKALIAFSRLLVEVFDHGDVLMRVGGDEFAVFLKDISRSDLEKKADKLVKAARGVEFSGYDYSMTCSAGVCFLPGDEPGRTYNWMFVRADQALYEAKKRGRNQYRMYRKGACQEK